MLTIQKLNKSLSSEGGQCSMTVVRGDGLGMEVPISYEVHDALSTLLLTPKPEYVRKQGFQNERRPEERFIVPDVVQEFTSFSVGEVEEEGEPFNVGEEPVQGRLGPLARQL